MNPVDITILMYPARLSLLMTFVDSGWWNLAIRNEFEFSHHLMVNWSIPRGREARNSAMNLWRSLQRNLSQRFLS